MRNLKVIHPFTILQIGNVEKWLKQKALNGYQLVHMKGWTFTFVKCLPKEHEYFLYQSPLLEKNDQFLDEFHFIYRQYYLRKSLLNNKSPSNIFEVDLRKIDQVYLLSHLSRTKHYLKYHIKWFLAKLFLFLGLLTISFFEKTILSFALLSLIPLLYSLFSILVLKHNLKKYKTGDQDKQ